VQEQRRTTDKIGCGAGNAQRTANVSSSKAVIDGLGDDPLNGHSRRMTAQPEVTPTNAVLSISATSAQNVDPCIARVAVARLQCAHQSTVAKERSSSPVILAA
jgi:hypothetical protein